MSRLFEVLICGKLHWEICKSTEMYFEDFVKVTTSKLVFFPLMHVFQESNLCKVMALKESGFKVKGDIIFD